ncbi:MAG: class I SAM-dependent methyltransferase [Candidatus Rokubacteria bacterium]|nr:class I SAM-dependent methyltransferase [Candidatus Rokubacteria bacterium]
MGRPVPSELTALERGSPERFGYSWDIFHEILPEHQEQFRRWTAPLPRSAWRGARFLDVGCGIGRNSYWAMEAGAAGGVAIDVDERSLAAARRNLSRFPAVEVRRQSAYDIADESAFDIVFSIGVLHHLGDPDAALRRMVQATRPGGRVLIWVYGRENNGWIVHGFDPLRRLLFSRLPLGVVYRLSAAPTLLLWTALRLGLGRLAYYRLLRRFSWRHLRAIVFDQMIPRVAHYWPRPHVERLLTNAGLADVQLEWVNQMSWAAAGTRPSR